MLTKSRLRVVSPNNEIRSVTPTRPPNADQRSREYLTPTEIDKLIAAAKTSRYPQRDATMVLVIYRHGLRASEACDLEWSQIAFDTATIHVTANRPPIRFAATRCGRYANSGVKRPGRMCSRPSEGRRSPPTHSWPPRQQI
jgi:integrase